MCSYNGGHFEIQNGRHAGDEKNKHVNIDFHN